LHHAIWTDLEELYQHMQERILVIERELASDLLTTWFAIVPMRLVAVVRSQSGNYCRLYLPDWRSKQPKKAKPGVGPELV
jgi:hypothetical protein